MATDQPTLADLIEAAAGPTPVRRVTIGHKVSCAVSKGQACDCLPPPTRANRPLPWKVGREFLNYPLGGEVHPAFAWTNQRVVFVKTEGVGWLPRDPIAGAPKLNGPSVRAGRKK